MIWSTRLLEQRGFVAPMSDDMVLHFSSNSSNQSDQSLPDKIAKLEARMVGKTSSVAVAAPVQQQQQQQQQPARSSASPAPKFVVATEELPEASTSSDSDDEVKHFRNIPIKRLVFLWGERMVVLIQELWGQGIIMLFNGYIISRLVWFDLGSTYICV